MILCFATTVLLSAILLFVMEPMVGKMLLPALGGSPAVWNACLMFFQAALLAGYAYAHAITRWDARRLLSPLRGLRSRAGQDPGLACRATDRRPFRANTAGTPSTLSARRSIVMHSILLVLPIAVLPIALPRGEAPAADAAPIAWLLGQLATGAGLPFFVLAATSPLLQRWLACTRHAAGRDPYFLYAASNAGSLAALLSYPLLIEPMLTLRQQSVAWAGGYGATAALLGLCAAATWRAGAAAAGPANADGDALRTPWSERITWMVYAFVPSSLVLGVTAHLTTNLAAMPLLWVIPLALYLLTFVLVFARRPPMSHETMTKLMPFVLVPAAPLFFATIPGLEWRSLFVHLAMFFVAAMVCHGELARRRPETRRLTEYYVWVAVGGLLGGAFNTLAAPLVFRDTLEYPLAMCAACLLRPRAGTTATRTTRMLDAVIPLAIAAGAVALVLALRATSLRGTWGGLAIVFAATAAACLLSHRRPIRLGLTYAAALLAMGLYTRLDEGRRLHSERNFFGVKRVVASEDGRLRWLYHGTTAHGVQGSDATGSREPLAYYHRGGPFGDVMAAVGSTGAVRDVAVVGLGVGALACYLEPDWRCVFYEIDPGVARIASDPRYFTYLTSARGAWSIALGDGRVMLGRERDRRFGLIVLDAYSSDAIPTHLLSREAVQLYLSRLADGGLVAFHITNRFFDLEPVLGNLAHSLGLSCLTRNETTEELGAAAQAEGKLTAQVVVLARRPDDFGPLRTNKRWQPARIVRGEALWTDQYCNLLQRLRVE